MGTFFCKTTIEDGSIHTKFSLLRICSQNQVAKKEEEIEKLERKLKDIDDIDGEG